MLISLENSIELSFDCVRQRLQFGSCLTNRIVGRVSASANRRFVERVDLVEPRGSSAQAVSKCRLNRFVPCTVLNTRLCFGSFSRLACVQHRLWHAVQGKWVKVQRRSGVFEARPQQDHTYVYTQAVNSHKRAAQSKVVRRMVPGVVRETLN